MRSRLTRMIGAALLVALGAGLIPAAASADQLIADLQLLSHRPGVPTGATLHLVWPDGPNGKAKEEKQGVFELPAGTVFNENAIPTCTASDEEMKALGRAACPAGSALGPGEVLLQ